MRPSFCCVADVAAMRAHADAVGAAGRVRMLVAAASYELMVGSSASNDASTRGALVAVHRDRRAAFAAARLAAAQTHVGRASALSAEYGGVHAALVSAARAATEVFAASAAARDESSAAANLSAAGAAGADLEPGGGTGLDRDTRGLLASTGHDAAAVAAAIDRAVAAARAARGGASGTSAATSAALAEGSIFVPAIAARAAAAFAAGDFAAARAAYVRLIAEAPHVAAAPVRTALGMCLHRMGYADAARAAFSRALQLQPNYAPALTALACLEGARLAAAAASASAGGSDAGSAAGSAMPVEAAAAEFRARNNVHELLRRAVEAGAAAGAGAGGAGASSALASASASTLLALAHCAFERFAPLTVSGTASGLGAPPGPAVTAALTHGSRRIIFSADVSGVLRPNQTLRFLVRRPNPTTKEAVPVAAPMRLAVAQPVAVVPVSALDAHLLAVHPALARLDPSTLVCVGRARSPWPFASASGVPVTAADAERSAVYAKAALEALGAAGGSAAAAASAAGSGAGAAAHGDLRAEAHYALARANHAASQFVDAGIEYRHCLATRPAFAPALFGSAQVAMGARRERDAEEALSRLLSLRNDDRSSSRLLVALKSQAASAAAAGTGAISALGEALDAARRAFDASPADPVAAAMYATLLARADTPASTARAYAVSEAIAERAARVGVAAPPAVFNNCGALALRRAQIETAGKERRQLLAAADRQLLRALDAVASELMPGAPQAAKSAPEAKTAALLSAAGITVAFNLARTAELQGRTAEAAMSYARILEASPSYVDGASASRPSHYPHG